MASGRGRRAPACPRRGAGGPHRQSPATKISVATVATRGIDPRWPAADCSPSVHDQGDHRGGREINRRPARPEEEAAPARRKSHGERRQAQLVALQRTPGRREWSCGQPTLSRAVAGPAVASAPTARAAPRSSASSPGSGDHGDEVSDRSVASMFRRERTRAWTRRHGRCGGQFGNGRPGAGRGSAPRDRQGQTDTSRRHPVAALDQQVLEGASLSGRAEGRRSIERNRVVARHSAEGGLERLEGRVKASESLSRSATGRPAS